MYQRLLDPSLAENDKQNEYQQVEGRYNKEGGRHTRIVCQPEGEGKGEIHQDSNDDEDKDDSQGGCR